jgi:hypothetical protein
MEHETLLSRLLSSLRTDQVRDILADIGDRADIGLDERFGAGYRWHAFGNNASNLSTIGIATKPGRSLAERLTNAIDAILEDRAPTGVELPDSPRLSVQQWFGRPVSGPDTGLFRWKYSASDIDKRIQLILQSSGMEAAPTVDVLDDGIGITPEMFESTILSLQGGNKIGKRYLIGSFGQGGAATLAFCDYALIVSRHRDAPDRVGFTVIRVLNLSNAYKEDSYAYLALAEPAARVLVPAVSISGEITLYSATDTKVPVFRKGTLVRHFGYKLDGLTGTFAPSPGNLYHYLHAMMFDPLLPFRIIDLREQHRSEIVTGSRNRLMKLANKESGDAEDTGSEVRHYREMEYVMPLGEHDSPIGVEYWVVLNYRKGRGPKKDRPVLRSQSNELYVQPTHPLLGTLNGQNHGEQTGQLLRELGLTMVSRHMVVHFDASQCPSRIRRQLFSTSREGLKDGPVLTHLLQVLKKMLEEDSDLYALERKLTEEVAQREAQTTSDEVKREVTKLLVEAGFQMTKEGPGFVEGAGEPQPIRQNRPGKHVKREPLPTLPFPQVTKWDIVSPATNLQIHSGDVETILVETDADGEFDRRGLVSFRAEPPVLEVAAKSPLRGGRVRWRVRTAEGSKPGARGTVFCTITRPDGTQLVATRAYEVLTPLEEKADKIKTQVPPFEIIPINPDDQPEQWNVAWPEVGDDASYDQQRKVAYRPVRLAGGITVYYSTIFTPFAAETERLKNQSSQVLHDLFRRNYEVWIGYHAILQDSNRPQNGPELERLLETERAHVAYMEVKQALKTAELMRKLMKEAVSTD